jgi:hypothetical protein
LKCDLSSNFIQEKKSCTDSRFGSFPVVVLFLDNAYVVADVLGFDQIVRAGIEHDALVGLRRELVGRGLVGTVRGGGLLGSRIHRAQKRRGLGQSLSLLSNSNQTNIVPFFSKIYNRVIFNLWDLLNILFMGDKGGLREGLIDKLLKELAFLGGY